MEKNGMFYSVKKRDYDKNIQNCIEQAMDKLDVIEDKPLMMLGKIQSGKTRTFIGLCALAFDNGYDLAIVLTKSSNALVKQTVARLKDEFREFIHNDEIDIFDIKKIPSDITKFELEKKIIIVVKKQTHNLNAMEKFIEEYSIDNNKYCLVFDDEADYASIGYEKKNVDETYDLRTIASQINNLRDHIECRFIQVTATPYSLYLQPDNLEANMNSKLDRIVPIKPADTVLVCHGNSYIGGDYYFNEEVNAYYSDLFYAIEDEELEIIKHSDRRRFKKEDALISSKIEGLRTAIINFIVGGCIRILQEEDNKSKRKRFSFVVHTQVQKKAHKNQKEIIDYLLDAMSEAIKCNDEIMITYLKISYNNLSDSILNQKFQIPSFEDVKSKVYEAIQNEWILKTIVNSENDIDALLDDSGQLRLRTPLNIFVGGQILDRGVTITNLIGFYYGRDPKKMQQDTVLQHARMYGYRDQKDLAVTRLYTTRSLYLKMKQINEFDGQLRKDFEDGKFDQGIIFMSKDINNKIIPCSPIKVRISNSRVLRKGNTLTPVGFNTNYKSYIKKDIQKIDQILTNANNGILDGQFSIHIDAALEIIECIYNTLEFEVDKYITKEQLISILRYLSKGKVHIYCATNREISRFKKTSRYYSDVPYSSSGDLSKARKQASDEPTLMLMKQTGKKENGWRDAQFYWPVVVVNDTHPAVYTSDVDIK